MTETTLEKLCLPPEEFLRVFEDELLDEDRCNDLIKKLETVRNIISEKINVENKESCITKLIELIGSAISNIKRALITGKKVEAVIHKDLDEIATYRKEMQERLDALHKADVQIQYTRVVQQIDKLNIEMKKEYLNNDNEKCATIFANLCEISRILHDSKAVHLRTYLKEVILYWHEILKEKFAKAFEDIMKTIKWPFVNANFSLITPSANHISKMQIIVEYLLQIEIPEEYQTRSTLPGILADFPQLCLPIHYLVQPFCKRFAYHFYGCRQTNRIDKPEWYFTQILSWIRDHIDFVSTWIQPVIDKLGMHHIDAKLELMSGLVRLAVDKLHSELPNLRFDDFTFSHSIDEALGFDKELRETYSYPANQPSILNVLTQGSIFHQWIKMEKKYAFEKMDSMLNNLTTAFEPLASEEEEFKITICADTFVTLLQTITERYESLPQPGHRLQFLDLQNELLDNFRIRLLQLIHLSADPKDLMDNRVASIANTSFYIENVLLDWGSMLHYLNLYYYKTQMEAAEHVDEEDKKSSNEEDIDDDEQGFEIETETVFADTLLLYSHMRRDLLCELSCAVVHEAKVKAYDYRHERWTTMMNHKDLREFSLTPTACPMFEVLARRLHQLQKSLAAKLFTIVWRFIAQELDNFLFDALILENRFNEGGAMQLKYDVHRNLFPLFSQFSDKPENYFLQLKESCSLLNISKGSALLLRETLVGLEGATGVEDRRGMALKEVGVTNFSPQMAIQILNRRTDITIYRNKT